MISCGSTTKTINPTREEQGVMEFIFDAQEQTMRCRFPVRMDAVNSMEAEKILDKGIKEITAQPEDIAVIFDLKGVEYISSAFLRLCLSIAKGVKKGGFSIINTEPQVMKVFKIAGLDGILQVS